MLRLVKLVNTSVTALILLALAMAAGCWLLAIVVLAVFACWFVRMVTLP